MLDKMFSKEDIGLFKKIAVYVGLALVGVAFLYVFGRALLGLLLFVLALCVGIWIGSKFGKKV